MRAISTLILATFVFGAAHASVTNLSAGYYVSTTQVSDDPPTTTEYHGFSAFVYGDTPGDLLAGTLTHPDTTIFNFYPNGDQMLIYSSPFFGSVAELLAAYPDGDYWIAVTAGLAAPDSGAISVPPPDFPDDIPYLTNGGYSALQMAPAGVDASISWNSFDHSGSADQALIALQIVDYTSTLTPIYTTGPNSTYTSETIPGSEMKSGHTYGYALYFNCYFNSMTAGFGGVPTVVSNVVATSGLYHVAADVGTVSGQLTLEYDSQIGEPVEVRIYDTDGNLEETQNITLGYFGYYAFETAIRGQKYVAFKGRHWLRKAALADLDAGVDFLDLTLRSGDIDEDNEVGIGDFALLSYAFDSYPGDPNWIENSDLNEDGTVDIGDYAIMSQSWGEVGDY